LVSPQASAPARGPHDDLLRVGGLTKHYGRTIALSGVSFTVRRGEVLGLIGPNGSGKTTLFECLGGVLPADDGRVERDGTTLDAAKRCASLFYLPDGIAPWPDLPVGWLLHYVAGSFKGDASKIQEVVRSLTLESLLESRLKTLSKGQRKRALLAMGLLTPQPVLLCDEPFDGLDLRQSREVAQTLRAAAAGGRTLVLSIHQISDAARVCDRFVLLSNGRICGEGTLEELKAAAEARGATGTGDLEEVFLALT
jgi:ABC-type multidrug transport system ATPase subunit